MTSTAKTRWILAAGGVATLLAVFYFYLRAPEPHDNEIRGTNPSEGTAQTAPVSGKNAPFNAGAPAVTQTSGEQAAASQQVAVLNDILSTRNDNDPRLDTELRTLSPQSKEAFRAKYQSLPREDRNDRGTVAFLLGRNIQNEQDLRFFREVINEPPCASLADCSKDVPAADPESRHLEGSTEITLAYPQLVTLNALEKLLVGGQDVSPAIRESAMKVIEEAQNSPIRIVAKKASGLWQTLNRR